MADHNEAMRLTEACKHGWLENVDPDKCSLDDLLSLLRQQAERIAELQSAHAIAVEIAAQYAAECDQLREEVERMRANAERWEYAMDWGTSGFAVCRRVGATGTCWEPIKTSGPLDAARTTHKETE